MSTSTYLDKEEFERFIKFIKDIDYKITDLAAIDSVKRASIYKRFKTKRIRRKFAREAVAIKEEKLKTIFENARF